MHLKLKLSALILSLLSLLPPSLSQIPPNTTHLIAPALVTLNNRTAIQCWRLTTTPFLTSSTPGTNGAQAATIGNVTNLGNILGPSAPSCPLSNRKNPAYTILPPRFDGGLHRAPVPQIVHFVSGLAHVSLPDDEAQELWITGGVGGLLIAADTTGLGHVTRYPGDRQTVGIVAPFEGGRVPEHEIVKEGPCEGSQTFM